MGWNKHSIHTSVDKLVELVNEFGKISFKDAAKKLAVPVSSIEEWAHLLEEEKIIKIDYHLATPMLVKNKLTESEQKKKIEQFEDEKELFDKKIAAATSYFHELDKKIELVSSLFSGLEGKVEKKLSDVEKEIKRLHNAEQEKEKLDEQILQAKERSTKKLREVEEHMAQAKVDYEKGYEASKKELAKDEELLEQSQKFLDKVKSQEKEIEDRLKEVRKMSDKIQKEVEVRSDMLTKAKMHIDELKSMHLVLKDDLEEEHKSLKRLIEENEEQEKVIGNIQKDIFAKMESEEKSLEEKEEEIRSLPEHFKEILDRRKEVVDLINTINHDEIELKQAIENLKRQSRMIKYAIGSDDYEKELEKLHAEVEKITDKRSFFKTKVEKLITLLSWSDGKKGK